MGDTIKKVPLGVVKVCSIGNSDGIVLTKEVEAVLGVTRGDNLYLTRTPSGIHLSPYDPEFATQMDAGRKIMKQRRNVLRKLAE